MPMPRRATTPSILHDKDALALMESVGHILNVQGTFAVVSSVVRQEDRVFAAADFRSDGATDGF